jgi:hypothetical protein
MIRRMLALVLVVSACSTAEQALPPPATTTTSTTTTTTTTTAMPTSTGPTVPQLQEMADRAAIAPNAMADFKITAAKIDEPQESSLTLFTGLCGKGVTYAGTAGRYRMFSGDTILVHSAAWSFMARTGAEVVNDITGFAKCTTWKDRDGFNHKITTDVPISRPAGVDGFFAYCDETEDTTKKFRYCAAIVSSGRTVIEVASAAHITRPNPVRDIPKVLPRAVERLLAA